MEDPHRDHGVPSRRRPGPACRRVCQLGLTIAELLTVVAVSAVLLGLGVPAFSHALVVTRLASTTNQLLLAAVTARQTAASLNVPVTFCAGNAAEGCHGQWPALEWIVFIDRDHDGRVDPEDSIRLSERLPDSDDVLLSGNGPFKKAVVFHPSGAAQTVNGAFAAGRLRICTTRLGTGNATDLVLIGSGRFEPEAHDFAGECPPAG
ncbi:GspH/FimT family pseudopilin [Solimonas flava]|uniref:GspH/FimT family pseudopilin n=1 Tax=Solimonas flava TaxID=415849 RepID=UPI0009FEAA43|nr:GspH/FimT family pseudopilin [Solimonas flava]